MAGIDLDAQLDAFVARVPEVTHVVAVSGDGLLLARNRDLPPDAADTLSAIVSGLVSLTQGAARSLQAAPVVSNLTEMAGGFWFTMSMSNGASLAAFADRGCDIGHVAHELAGLINKVAPALSPHVRTRALAAPGLDR